MPTYDHTVEHSAPAPGRDRSRLAYGLVALVIILGVGAWFYMVNRPHPAQVVKQDIVGQIPLNGAIVVPPGAQADVYAPFAAPIEKVAVSLGQHVEKGDLLVQLQIANAEAYHEQTKQAEKQAETAYANAMNQLNGPVLEAQRQLDAARAATRAAQPSAQDPNAPAPPPAPAPTVDVAAAESALQQAFASRDAQLIAFKQQLDAAREANRQARAGERIGELRAPITGTVVALNAQPGQVPKADQKTPLATVVNLSEIQIQGSAPKEQSSGLKKGMPVILTFTELPGQEFSGEISNVTSRVDEKAAGLIKTQQVVAVIDFKNRDALVRPGMTAQVAVKTGEVKDALAVPIEAVDTDSTGRPVIHVLRNGNWQDVAVSTGLSDGHVVQVKSGVGAGETIKVTPDVLHAASPIRAR